MASLGELAQALHVGFPPDRIVFDSPAKTRAELAYALERGVPVNLDNFQVGVTADGGYSRKCPLLLHTRLQTSGPVLHAQARCCVAA